MEKSELLAKIESLDIKDAWRKKFKLYAEAGVKRGRFFADIENKRVLSSNVGAKFNVFGAIFGHLYYLYLKMYKKACSLVLLTLVMQGLMGFILGFLSSFAERLAPRALVFLSPEFAGVSATVVMVVLIASMVNYDYYRRRVLDEDFWW